MSEHTEKTLDSDGRKRQRGQEKKKSRMSVLRALDVTVEAFIEHNCRFCHTTIYTNIYAKICLT